MDKAFLIGDSIRMGYDRYVRCALSGRAEVYYPAEPCRFAQYILRYAHDWIAKECEMDKVTVIHFNCGHWDTLHLYGDESLTPINVYGDYLARIVKRFRALCPRAQLIFATTTPVLDARCGDDRVKYRRDADSVAYNQVARAVMKDMNVAIDDLYAVAKALPESAYTDMLHLNTPEGGKALGDAVVKSIRPYLAR